MRLAYLKIPYAYGTEWTIILLNPRMDWQRHELLPNESVFLVPGTGLVE